MNARTYPKYSKVLKRSISFKTSFPNAKRIFRNENVSLEVQRVRFHCSIIDFRSKMIVFTYEKT